MEVISYDTVNSIVQIIIGHNARVTEFAVEKKEVDNASLYWIKTKLEATSIKGPTFVLKKLPNAPEHVKSINDARLFDKEIIFYEQILPELKVFQSERGISKKSFLNPGPTYYLAKSDGENDFIALEDLTRDKFHSSFTSGGLDLVEARLVMKYLAKFHAISFMKFSGKWDRILEKYPLLREFNYIPENEIKHKPFCEAHFRQEAKLLRQASEEYEKDALVLENIMKGDYYEKFCKFLNPNVKNAVITHGDPFKENILFQYSEDDQETPIMLKFIDFQHSVVGARALDLTYFLYTSTQIKVLNENENELLRHYFEEFQESVKSLDQTNDASIPTFEDLIQEYNEYRYFGVFLGILYAPISSRIKGEIREQDCLWEGEAPNPEAKSEKYFSTLTGDQRTIERLVNLTRNHLQNVDQ